MSDIRIPAFVTIRDAVDQRSWRAELPNGKVILVYQRKSANFPPIKTGDRCTVHLSLCDFDHGKIVAAESAGAALR